MSRVIAAYAACAVIWGTTWSAIRICIQPGGYPVVDAVALRFAIAAVILVPIAARLRPWPTGRTLRYLVLAGLLDALGYALVYVGEARVQGGVAAVLYGTQPLVLAILLIATKLERVTRRDLIGAVVSIVGVAVLFVDRLEVSTQQALGVTLVLGSVVVSTIYAMVMKRHAADVHPVIATTIFIAVTAVALGAAAIIARDPLPWPPPTGPTIALVYLAVVGSVVAFLSYFWLLRRTRLAVTTTLVFVFPLVALAADLVVEPGASAALGARGYLGVAITLGGLAVSLRARAGA